MTTRFLLATIVALSLLVAGTSAWIEDYYAPKVLVDIRNKSGGQAMGKLTYDSENAVNIASPPRRFQPLGGALTIAWQYDCRGQHLPPSYLGLPVFSVVLAAGGGEDGVGSETVRGSGTKVFPYYSARDLAVDLATRCKYWHVRITSSRAIDWTHADWGVAVPDERLVGAPYLSYSRSDIEAHPWWYQPHVIQVKP